MKYSYEELEQKFYSFVEMISSPNFDWYFDSEVSLWRKDGWTTRTTAELFDLFKLR